MWPDNCFEVLDRAARGRAWQGAPQRAWSGKPENVATAQRALSRRAGLASLEIRMTIDIRPRYSRCTIQGKIRRLR
jgi:hypothetical protein